MLIEFCNSFVTRLLIIDYKIPDKTPDKSYKTPDKRLQDS